jgi:hypothetical protein
MDEQDLIYGLELFKFNGDGLGYIEEDSFDWGGAVGELTEIRAAQKKGYPVKVIPKSNGTQKPTFDLIQFNFANLKKVLGGETITKTGDVVIGWSAPSTIVMITGRVEIKTDSGQMIVMPNCMVQGYIGGNLNLTSVSKIKCTLSIMEPVESAEPAFKIYDADEYALLQSQEG